MSTRSAFLASSSLRKLDRSQRVEPCNLCDGQQFLRIGNYDRRGRMLHSVVCQGCGLISHETIPSDEELAQYYQAEYRRTYKREIAPSAIRVVRAWDVGAWILRQLQPRVQPFARVFEIGAGLGATVKQFELAGFQAQGIEPHDGFREFGRRQLHARLEAGVINDIPIQPAHDLILLIHVLEHLPRPKEALNRVCQLLRSNGKCHIEVPNISAPHAAPGKLFHYAHIYNFTPDTLIALGASAGLKVDHKFSDDDQGTVRILFQKDQRFPCRLPDEESVRRNIAGMMRFNKLTYYLRSAYLKRRALQCYQYLSERATADQRLQEILALCAEPAAELRRAA